MCMYELDKFEWFSHKKENGSMGGRKSPFEFSFSKKISEGLIDCHYLQ